MGEQDTKAAGAEREQLLVQPDRPTLVGELDEQRARPAERQSLKLRRGKPSRLLQRELAACDEPDCETRGLGRGGHLPEPLLHLFGRGRIVRADVRRGREHRDALGLGLANHGDALLDGAGTVVEPEEHVAVEVYHRLIRSSSEHTP